MEVSRFIANLRAVRQEQASVAAFASYTKHDAAAAAAHCYVRSIESSTGLTAHAVWNRVDRMVHGIVVYGDPAAALDQVAHWAVAELLAEACHRSESISAGAVSRFLEGA